MQDGFFKVVINHEEQYAIWPSFKAVPEGWYEAGCEGEKSQCLEYIRENWTDMRPASLRAFLQEKS